MRVTTDATIFLTPKKNLSSLTIRHLPLFVTVKTVVWSDSNPISCRAFFRITPFVTPSFVTPSFARAPYLQRPALRHVLHRIGNSSENIDVKPIEIVKMGGYLILPSNIELVVTWDEFLTGHQHIWTSKYMQRGFPGKLSFIEQPSEMTHLG